MEQSAIQSEAVEFFAQLYQGEEPTELNTILENIPTLLSQSDGESLLRPITLEEVK